MAFDSNNVLLFAVLAVVFFIVIIAALAWGYGRLSARNRNSGEKNS